MTHGIQVTRSQFKRIGSRHRIPAIGHLNSAFHPKSAPPLGENESYRQFWAKSGPLKEIVASSLNLDRSRFRALEFQKEIADFGDRKADYVVVIPFELLDQGVA